MTEVLLPLREAWVSSTFERKSLHLIQEVLRDLHDSINAIGGAPANEYERGSNDTVGKALAIIEAKQAEVGQ